MSELAAELGHSLVFPVMCRYCGQPVYLFASPNGGFAVFEALGVPWPKHLCNKLAECKVIDCSFPEPRPARYQLPVPDTVEFRSPFYEYPLSGVVVGVQAWSQPRRKKPLWAIDIYDGKFLYRIKVDRDFPLGAFVRGVVKSIPDLGIFLQSADHYLPPGYTEKA